MLGAEQCRAVRTTSQNNPEQVKIDVSVKVYPKTHKVSELLSCILYWTMGKIKIDDAAL